MAEYLPPVVAELVAKTDAFRKDMLKAQSQMKAVEKAGGGSFDKLAKVGRAAFFSLGAAAVGFGAIAVKEAQSQEAANARLTQALSNVGSALDANAKPFEDAQAAARKLGFEDQEATDSLSKLVAATRSPQKALRDLALAEDVARGRGIDLASATDILTKVETGHVALLGRIGINTKDATGATISQEEAIRRLTDLYGGQASAYSKTFAGRLATLRAETNQLAENVGNFLIPKIEAATHAGNTAIEWLHKHGDAARALAAVIGGPVVAALGAYVAIQARAAAASLAANASTVAVGGGLAAIAALITHNISNADKFAARIKAAAGSDPQAQLDALKGKLAELNRELVGAAHWGPIYVSSDEAHDANNVNSIKSAIKDLEAQIQGEKVTAAAASGVHVQMGDAFIEAAADADQLDAKIKSMQGSIAANISAQQSYKDSLQRVDDATKSVADAHRAVDDAIAKAVVDTKAVAAAQKDLERSSLAVADAEERVADARKKLSALEQGPKPRDVAQAQLRVSEAMRAQERAQVNLHEKQKHLKDLQFDSTRTADDYKSAQLDLADANDGVRQAQIDAADSQDALNALVNQGQAGSDEYTQAQRELRDAERALKDAQDGQRDAQEKLNQANTVDPSLTDAVKTAKDRLADAERGLRDAKAGVAQASFNAAEAEAAARAEVEKSLPAAIQLRTQLDAIGAQYPAALSYIGALEAMLPPPIPSGPDSVLPDFSRGGVRRFALGGVVDAPLGMPVPAIVHGGEEVLTPGQRGRGGSVQVVVPVILDGREVARVVTPYVRDEVNKNGKRNSGLARV